MFVSTICPARYLSKGIKGHDDMYNYNQVGMCAKSKEWFNSTIRWKIAGSILSKQRRMQVAIVGFPKCATTSVQVNLSNQDGIDIPGHEVQTIDLLRKRVSFSEKANLCGIKNPNLIYETHNLRAIIKANPDIKLIIGLRNPANWLYSFYQYRKYEMSRAEGSWVKNKAKKLPELETITFDEVVYNNADLLGASRSKGNFVDYLKPVITWVEPGQVLIYFLEEMAQEPEKTYGRIFDFLGLEHMDCSMMLQANRKAKNYEKKQHFQEQMEYLSNYYSEKNSELNQFLGENWNIVNPYW